MTAFVRSFRIKIGAKAKSTVIVAAASVLSLLMAPLIANSLQLGIIGVAKADSVTATLPVGRLPNDVALDSTNGLLYVPNYESQTVSVINPTAHTVSTITLPPVGGSDILGPYGALYNPINDMIYVSEQAQHQVVLLIPATERVFTSIPLGVLSPSYMTFNPFNGLIYVTDPYQDKVSVIKGTTVVATIPLPSGSFPVFLGFDSANGNIYVANENSNSLSVIRGLTVVGTIPLGALPEGVVYDSTNGLLYVSLNNKHTVDVIKLSATSGAVIDQIVFPINTSPTGIAFSNKNGHLYVAALPDLVKIINGGTNTVIQTLTVGSQPVTATWDHLNAKVYVSNHCCSGIKGSVSEISLGP